jgi:hypothetical protein
MRKLAAALAVLVIAASTFAAEPSRREKIDKLVTLSHAEDLEKAALVAALNALDAAATTPEQKEAVRQLSLRAATRSTRDVWVSSFERNLDDKTLAAMLAMYESEAAERASAVMRTALVDAMHERLRAGESDKNTRAARSTMADMRTLATALEARATDTNGYPESCDLETLRRLVEPMYIRHMPTRDGWGHELLYIGSPSHVEYRIVSAGSDGIFQADSRILKDTSMEFIQAPRVLLDKNQ